MGCASGSTDTIWTAGDYITETFYGTNLDSVGQISFNLSLHNTLVGATTETWLIFLEGQQIGSFTANSSLTNYSGSFSFAPINGISFGNGPVGFNIIFQVKDTVSDGDGKLGLQTGTAGTSTATLTGGLTPTPEPSAFYPLLTASGLGIVTIWRRRAS